MPQFKNISGQPRDVAYGCAKQRVEPDGMLLVVPGAADAYACQTDVWQPVTETTPAADRPSEKTAPPAATAAPDSAE